MSFGVHLAGGGSKDCVDVSGLTFLQIAFLIPRISPEVFVRPELGLIDKQRQYRRICPTICLAHQRQMPLMEESHRRDQGEPLVRSAGFRCVAQSLVDSAQNSKAQGADTPRQGRRLQLPPVPPDHSPPAARDWRPPIESSST